MKIIQKVVLILVIIGAGVLGYLMGNKTPTGAIKIGLSLPMTGEASIYGEAALGGALLAVKEINDLGGINGRKIELVLEDDKCSPEGVTAINKLVNVDQVVAIVGPLCSPVAGGGVVIAQNAKVPVIMLASAPLLPTGKDFIFRNYPSDTFQGRFAAEFVYNELGKRRTAIVYVKNDWGQGIRDVFVKSYKGLGGEIVYDEGVLQDTNDMRTVVSQIKESNPDILFFPAHPQVVIIGLKQMKELGMDTPILGADSFVGKELQELDEAEGIIYVVGKTNHPQEFQDKVKEETGKISNAFTPFVYDAVKIIAKAIDEVGTNKEALRSKIASTYYTEGIALPVIEFDNEGNLNSAEFEVRIIRNKESVEYTK